MYYLDRIYCLKKNYCLNTLTLFGKSLLNSFTTLSNEHSYTPTAFIDWPF